MGNRSNPKEHRLELTQQLLIIFRKRGFDGATIAELSRITGLGKASLYHHFPGGKEEMADELIRLCCNHLNENAFRHLKHGGPAAKRFQAFLKGFSDYVEAGEANCLLAVLSLRDSPASKAFLRIQTLDWINQLRRFFRKSGLPKKASRRRALEVMTRLQGALVIDRMTGDPGVFMQTTSELLTLLPD